MWRVGTLTEELPVRKSDVVSSVITVQGLASEDACGDIGTTFRVKWFVWGPRLR